MALAISVAFLALAAVIVAVLVPGVLDCSPPSDEELAQQETFVREHFTDVQDVGSGVGDCDDGGRGYVSFATSLSPAAARDKLLADPACGDPGDLGDIAVQCRSSKKVVDVFLEQDPRDKTTRGSLEFK